MVLYDKVLSGEEKISVIGLGYVGLPIAIAFSQKIDVIGFDINAEKVKRYQQGIDSTCEVGNEKIAESNMKFTSDEKSLRDAVFHIVAVPTPVNEDHTPDLSPIKTASEILGRNLKRGSIVVYESTVYPGVTEEVCVPILENQSGLKCGVDFNIGYSPERINPGDKLHRLENIVKIVSGNNKDTLEEIAQIYGIIIKAGIYKADSIKVAEAAKVIENSQRDINIAFMNELSIIFNKMGIDTKAVLDAAGTKWNFLNFKPGLVGGHCIGVDPYYLTYKAELLGYHSQVILAGRQINDNMGKYVAEISVKKLIKAGKSVSGSRVAVFGITFKENCPDVRNSKVHDIIKELKEYGIIPMVYDPVADVEDVKRIYGVDLVALDDVKEIDEAIFAVGHDEFIKLSVNEISRFFNNGEKILIDVKGIFDRNSFEEKNYTYWRL